MEQTKAGWWSGLAGVVIFSGSLPATRVAVIDFSPLFLTSARAVIAALLAAGLLLLLRQRRSQRGDIIPLLIIAAGVVVGFPLLTALALRHITAAHSLVFIDCCRFQRQSSASCAAASDPGQPSGYSPCSVPRPWRALRSPAERAAHSAVIR